MRFEEFAQYCGSVFAEIPIVGAESRNEMGVDVELASNFSVYEDGDDNFGFGFDGAGEIARVVIDVVDYDSLAARLRGNADALI